MVKRLHIYLIIQCIAFVLTFYEDVSYFMYVILDIVALSFSTINHLVTMLAILQINNSVPNCMSRQIITT
jgi:hypothetical protein